MSSGWPFMMAVTLAALVGTGVLSGSETGLLSLDRLRLRRARASETRGERLLGHLVSRQRALLVTLLVGNTVILVSSSVLLTGAAKSRWGPGSSLGVTVALTLLLFTWGELIPKAVFRRHAHAAMKGVAVPLLAIHLILRPITVLATLLVAGLLALLGRGRPSAFLVSRESLRRLLAGSKEAGLGSDEGSMLERVLRMRSTTCREVMIPLADVISVPEDAPTAAVLEAVRRGGPTRLPVYRQRVDHIVGLVNVFDILYDPQPRPDVRSYLRPLDIMPETQKVDSLLVDLRRRRSGMAAVVSEFGSCVGIVTVEDVVEEIVGELADEHEVAVPHVVRVGEGVYLVDARADLKTLARETGASLGDTPAATVGGLILSRLGRVPAVGETVEADGFRLHVISADRYGVRRVRFTLSPASGERGGSAGS